MLAGARQDLGRVAWLRDTLELPDAMLVHYIGKEVGPGPMAAHLRVCVLCLRSAVGPQVRFSRCPRASSSHRAPPTGVLILWFRPRRLDTSDRAVELVPRMCNV